MGEGREVGRKGEKRGRYSKEGGRERRIRFCVLVRKIFKSREVSTCTVQVHGTCADSVVGQGWSPGSQAA